ncbi:MAG: GDP-mannose 4,6-dehydratase [Acidobacteria bacterium]|nr:GDP-mannose 4,6-dehydratase [Acidobacteriota bacterium]
MRALVTGTAGFIGSHLADALLASGADVTGIDCFTDYYSRDIKEANLGGIRRNPAFRFVEVRIQDADFDALLAGVTHVFHLAAQAGVRKSWGRDFRVYTENNVDASQQLLEACARRQLHRFVYASSSSLYGDAAQIPMREDALPQPLSPYGVTKLAAEQLCHLYYVNYGVPATSVVLDMIGRLAGKPLTIRREPPQKGDMRDTYADTTLARADLGFTPRVSLEQGIEAEYRWLATTPALR